MGVEMWVKVFSPEVQSVEIVQRSEKRKRARLYYMRYVCVLFTGSGLRVCLLTLLQTTQTRHGQRGEHRVQLPQEEVGSHGSEKGETVIVECGSGVRFGFCDCIITAVLSSPFHVYE